MSTLNFEVRSTNFHALEDRKTSTSPYAASSEVLSRHHTREAAERSAKRCHFGACTCGCAVVVDLVEVAREKAILDRYHAEAEYGPDSAS